MLGKNKVLTGLTLGFLVLGMGITMPSCPGQQAMQQQIDALQTSNADLTKKVQMMDANSKSMSTEFVQAKQLLAQMTTTIQAQKGAIDQLDGAIKALETKVNAMAVPARKAPAKAKKRR